MAEDATSVDELVEMLAKVEKKLKKASAQKGDEDADAKAAKLQKKLTKLQAQHEVAVAAETAASEAAGTKRGKGMCFHNPLLISCRVKEVGMHH